MALDIYRYIYIRYTFFRYLNFFLQTKDPIPLKIHEGDDYS